MEKQKGIGMAIATPKEVKRFGWLILLVVVAIAVFALILVSH